MCVGLSDDSTDAFSYARFGDIGNGSEWYKLSDSTRYRNFLYGERCFVVECTRWSDILYKEVLAEKIL
jgi:hypothetical protein